eukprot:scaffold5025_cov145-Amphora_coffeaeformis.AAC.11
MDGYAILIVWVRVPSSGFGHDGTASHKACESIGGWSIGGCATFCKHAQLFGEDHLFGSQLGDWVLRDVNSGEENDRSKVRESFAILGNDLFDGVVSLTILPFSRSFDRTLHRINLFRLFSPSTPLN